MSKVPANADRFMDFMRYISMLKEDDEKRIQGQKLIDKIYEIQNFSQYKGSNISLHVLEHESLIQEEDGVEESA
jgi:hypothetical protein